MEVAILAPLAAGLVAGLIHVLSGPDHLAAMAPLAASSRRRGWVAGSSWGLGHTAGVWAVAGVSLLCRGILPLDRLSSWGERAVGAMLIGVGLWGLRHAWRFHAHEHEHGGLRHRHLHLHLARSARGQAHVPHAHTHAAIGIGALHGLAGSSHLLGILPALALPTTAAAVQYVLAFGVGSIAAMTAFSAGIGALAGRFEVGARRAHGWLLASCSGAAVLVGCFWLAR